MRRKIPTFDEGEFGFTGFSRFLRAAADSKMISLKNNAQGDGLLIDVHSAKDSEKVDLLERDLSFVSEETKRLYNILVQDGLHPTTHVIRHTVVHEFVDNCLDRQAKRKRSTLFYAKGDIERRCRKTTPFVEGTFVRSILDALHGAHVLLHPNGGSVRSQKVAFIIKADAEEMLNRLREYYVQHLKNKGVNILDPLVLSELFWNDQKHEDDAKKLLRKQKSQDGTNISSTVSTPAKSSVEDDDDDLFDLGLAWEDSTPENKKDKGTQDVGNISSEDQLEQRDTPTKQSKKKTSSKQTMNNQNQSVDSPDIEKTVEIDAEVQSEQVEQKTKNTRSRKKMTKSQKVETEQVSEKEVPAKKAKKTTKTRSRSKKLDDGETKIKAKRTTRKTSNKSSDTTKKKPTTRKTTRKKADVSTEQPLSETSET